METNHVKWHIMFVTTLSVKHRTCTVLFLKDKKRTQICAKVFKVWILNSHSNDKKIKSPVWKYSISYKTSYVQDESYGVEAVMWNLTHLEGQLGAASTGKPGWVL